MTKRSAAAVLFFLLLRTASAADWRTELLTFLGPRPDYRRALEYLSAQAGGLEAADLQTAEALVPYLAWKAGDAALEQDRISDYFERYLDNDPEFGFLDEFTHRDFLTFWARWKSRYPLVSDLNLLSYGGAEGSDLPARLDVGLELLNDAFYKLSLGPYALEGGFWTKGFHILTIPVSGLVARAGTYEFVLDLKAGELLVRKPVGIVVELQTAGQAGGLAAPVLPRIDNSRFRRPAGETPATTEGWLSLYVGGKLIMKSRKLAPHAPPLNIPLAGPSMPGQKPYMPPPANDPMANSASILDAIALAYTALKALMAKKPPAPSPPSYQKVSSMSFTFAQASGDGAFRNARATVRLAKARAVVLRR
jgi:hypothetical protein